MATKKVIKETTEMNKERSSAVVTINEFAEMVKEELGARGVQARVQEVQKNNGIMYQAVIIEEDGYNVMPILYLDGYYEGYKNGKSIDGIASEIIESNEKLRFDGDIDISFVKDWDNVKDRVFYQLVGKENNQELLRDVPSVDFLDMAIIFRISFMSGLDACASALIRNSHLEIWGIKVSDLMDSAVKNTHSLREADVQSMADVIGEMIGESGPDNGMTIVSNKLKNLGAAVILYPDMLVELEKRLGSDYYIMPSSVHEVIALPNTEVVNADDLRELVKEVNRTQVAPEEVLTDSVYIFTNGELKVA